MTNSLVSIKAPGNLGNEPEVEVFAVSQLKKAGYVLTLRKCKSALLNKHWPSKTKKGAKPGYPDILLYLESMEKPICVWENKAPTESASDALDEAKFYIEGLRIALPQEPALPFIAAGFNGKELKLALYNNDAKWVTIKSDGVELKNAFPESTYLASGINAQGVFTAKGGSATVADLRALLPKLKTFYRNIPVLASGRVPIDFTVALLTLKLIIEQRPDWGPWGEQPRFSPGSSSLDHAIGERIETLTNRILHDSSLKDKYGDIFVFHEKSDTLEIAFSFIEILGKIHKGDGHFIKLFDILDQLPPLHGADFDIFGEVYQAIGDEATKKKLGEFFTGRHIIGGVLPVLFNRAGLDKSFLVLRNKKLADIACGTGGFLTEMLRLARKLHQINEKQVKSFAKDAFFGYDLGHANASRARVNMYFAGDGFSDIRGGFDSMATESLKKFHSSGFDVIATNPPYGSSSYGRTEEAFLMRTLDILKPGTGWGCIVLPTGVLENPRSSPARFNLMNLAHVTDVISLPKHAFAPYTQQKTAIVIFQRRKKALVSAGASWEELIEACANERVSMFIVDNDGFANSDKRYPTDRTDFNGAWLHNDLSEWTDAKGLRRPSKLYDALINYQEPKKSVNEAGEPLGNKFGVFSPSDLKDKERGVALLPDIPLRDGVRSLSMIEWEQRVDAVIAFSKGEAIILPKSFKSEVDFLLDHTISLPVSSLQKKMKIKDLFFIEKGDTNLTEAAIYKHIDAKNGLPVYGGGSGTPRFKAGKSLKRLTGEAATLFNGPALVISMDGSSGTVQVIEHGSFYCNHHGAVLKPKNAATSLWCFAQLAESTLKRLASNKEGSATLTKPALESVFVRLPKVTSVSNAIEKRRKELIALSRLTR